MYLRALNALGATNPYYVGGQKIWMPGSGIDPASCEASGGVVSWTAFSYDMNGTPSGIVYSCRYPPAASSTPAAQPQPPVTVTTNVQSQVSPQVSPTFVQQSSPTNSPVGAAPQSYPNASPQSPSTSTTGASGADIAAILQEQQAAMQAEADRQAANDAAILDAINRSGATPQNPQAQPTYVSESAPTPSSPAVVTNAPAVALPSNLQRAMPWIALAGFGVTVLAYMDSKKAKSKSGAPSRRKRK